jgi:hypothetical protein
MSIFSRKKKVNLTEFCTAYYDEFFFGKTEVAETYYSLISKKIVEVDSDFQKVNNSNLANEILILRLELFSLAWFHKFGHKYSIEQAVFTKTYLTNKGLISIWEAMEPYNQAIAKSALHGYTSDTISGRVHILDVNKTRVDLFKKYHSEGVDNKCIARSLNKYGTQPSWDSLSITLHYLAYSFFLHFNHEANEESTFTFVAILKGFYEGSKQSLEEIKIAS